MSYKKMTEKLKRLVDITKMTDSAKSKKDLKKLREEIGAAGLKEHMGGGDASRAELTENIQQALQTEAVIEMCRITSRNYKIAFVATMAAVLSALAAWIAVLANLLLFAKNKAGY